MNSRERVLSTIRHELPDRVPIDLGGMRSTGIMAIPYAQLKRHLGIQEGDVYVYDIGQQLALVESPVLEQFGCDVVPLDDGALGSWQEYTLPDGTPAKIPVAFESQPDGEDGLYLIKEGRRIARMPSSSYYFDSIYHPLADATSVSDLDAFDWPELDDKTLDRLRTEAQRLYYETDYAIMGAFGGAFLEAGQGLRGWAQFMIDLATNRPFAEALLDKLLETHLINIRRYLDAVGDYIQIVQVGGDLGTQAGPQINPRWYYEIIQPRQKVLWSTIHRISNCAVFLHTCGGIYPLIPGIIEAGCDILNPVQTSAADMDPVQLEMEFGSRLAFWGGGCDTQEILPYATPDDVYEHVSERMDIFKPGGGFVFTQIHNIQVGVRPENVVAMYEAVHDHWVYEQ